MSLYNELKEMFVDEEKLSDMMYGDCGYDPLYQIREYDIENKKYVYTGKTRVVSGGYGKELTESNISFELIKHYGGEDMGSEYYAVWKFTKEGEEVYIKFNGYYQSYNGADYQSFYKVEPKVKSIVVYE